MSKKTLEKFECAKLNLQEIVVGGEFICTTFTEENGSGGGSDVYDTETKRMSYIE